MVALTNLRFLYSFRYSEHINLTQVFDFFPLTYPYHAYMCGLPLL
jgi:hypothetical protein